MTGQQIIDKFETIVGDSLDPDFTLQLVNDAKNSIETELQLEITKKVNSSGSVTAGQTYTTSRSLPADFFSPLAVWVGTRPLTPVPFEHQHLYQSDSSKYWIDLANSNYYLGGTQGTAGTIYFYYQRATDDLVTNTSPVWPTRFHSLIPYEMARKYFAIDQLEKSRSWLPEHQTFYMEIKRQMIDWDARLKLNALNYSASPESYDYESENRINL